MNKLLIIFVSIFVFCCSVCADNAIEILPANDQDNKPYLQVDDLKSEKEKIKFLESNAEMFMGKNQYSFALDIYNELLNNRKLPKRKKFKYYVILGDIYSLQKKYDFSLECYKKASDLYKKNIEVKLKKGDIFLKGNLYNLAQISFSDVLEIDKNSECAKKGLGDIFYCQGLNTKAICYYKQINPENYNEETVKRIVSCYRDLGMFDDAIRVLDVFVKDNKITELFFLYGLLFADKKEYSTAKDMFLKAIESDRNDFKSYVYLALIYDLTGEIEKAKKMFDKAYSINSSYAVVDLMRAEIAYKMKRFDEAKEYAEDAYKKTKVNFVKDQAQKMIDFFNGKQVLLSR